MNKEQRIKQLEERFVELIKSINETVAVEVEQQLARTELQKLLIQAREAKEARDKQARKIADFWTNVYGEAIAPLLDAIKCPYDERDCGFKIKECANCMYGPSPFKKGDWIRDKIEGHDEHLFQFSHVEQRPDRLLAIGLKSNDGRYTLANLKDCKKWEPRKGEKVIVVCGARENSFIGIYLSQLDESASRSSPGFIHNVGHTTVKNIIPFISMEQYDKIIKGE